MKENNYIVVAAIIILLICAIAACNNPFDTRNAQKPDQIGGDAIKPATSPENVLDNLETAFKNQSIQDYLDLFSDDFSFNPDPTDSLRFVEDFRSGWGMEKEQIYAESFLQRSVTKDVYFYSHLVDYKPGYDHYDYVYSIKVTVAIDSTRSQDETIQKDYMVKGHAWIYLKEDDEGKWKICQWVERENMQEGVYKTWAVLRRDHI